MTKRHPRYFIVKLYQLSIYSNISKIRNQPEYGFNTIEEAEDHILTLNDNDWEYQQYELSIHKLWVKDMK